MNKTIITLLFLCSALSWRSVAAQSVDFKVIALFKNAAMIEHGGKQKLLRSGQNYKNSITLIAADSHAATFLIDGKEIVLGLHKNKIGGMVLAKDKPKEAKFVRIARDGTGMYRTVGFINGVQVNFLVDTGASQVAMNERTARRIGIQYKLYGQKTGVSTAAGRSMAWFLSLDKVNVGGVELKQVEALVIKGSGPDEVLLGMSFLRQLRMQDDGNLLKLSKKF
jgi:aspartyl protease family protein